MAMYEDINSMQSEQGQRNGLPPPPGLTKQWLDGLTDASYKVSTFSGFDNLPWWTTGPFICQTDDDMNPPFPVTVQDNVIDNTWTDEPFKTQPVNGIGKSDEGPVVDILADMPWPKFAQPTQAYQVFEHDGSAKTQKPLQIQSSFAEESIGTALHKSGTCKPCLFVTNQFGCIDGANCQFCHLRHTRVDRPRPSKQKRERFKKFQERIFSQAELPLNLPRDDARPQQPVPSHMENEGLYHL